MKLNLVRHSMTSPRARLLVLGAVLGLLLAAGTLAVGATALFSTTVAADLIAAALAVWAVGWLLGPLFAGGGEGDLRPEQFALLPVSPRRLATGLLGARLGALPVLVALPAVLAQLVIVVLASRVVVGLLGEVMRSRLGAALVAVPWAVIIAAVCDGGVLLYALGQNSVLTRGFDPWLGSLLRALPSGWGLVSVETAGGTAWPLAFGVLAGMGVLVLALLAVWSVLLGRRTTGALAARARVGGTALGRGLPRTPLGAVVAKELRTWSRDMLRSYYWFFALAFSLALCLLPLVAGLTIYLPWAGSLVAIMAAAVGVNLYSADGSALWISLMTPGVLRADLRGRQLAWLLVVAPTSLVITVLGLALGADPQRRGDRRGRGPHGPAGGVRAAAPA
ncbi:hypothetical protein [Kutzneria albida]|uniref:Putative secreted protein n=1 Tax=Kutzneria albida DSM 43870 TaxID=1449976 RepID=W5W8Z5_9PSEU|nr:hypothetical protein [Kutzneria albida]AHH97200.1 putative secreted protein [Kutzneria albida DSM 43870]